eukprot:9473318-Pyramimonas_sp.AAC.1
MQRPCKRFRSVIRWYKHNPDAVHDMRRTPSSRSLRWPPCRGARSARQGGRPRTMRGAAWSATLRPTTSLSACDLAGPGRTQQRSPRMRCGRRRTSSPS